jgi:hypothetical protein
VLELHAKLDKISVQEAYRVVSTGNAPSSSSTSKDKPMDLMVRICSSFQIKTESNHLAHFRQLDNAAIMDGSEWSETGRSKPARLESDTTMTKRMAYHSGESRTSGENTKENCQKDVKLQGDPQIRLLQSRMVNFGN